MRKVKTRCVHFNGYRPCRSHKLRGAACEECGDYQPFEGRILILKVGAAGEVIRNTPLLHRIRELYPHAEITWMTDFPEFVPRSYVNRILSYDWKNTQLIRDEAFDLLLNLDKEHHVCSLATVLHAQKKKGFLLDKNGRVVPADTDAERKWLTGVFDDLMRENTKHYVEEIYEVCGWRWKGEQYILEDCRVPPVSFTKHSDRPLVGLNTGAGNIWPTRVWPADKWKELITLLKGKGYDVLMLGGPLEHEKNTVLSRETGAYYEGVKTLREFTGLISLCDLVTTAVTMALHISIGLGKKVVLLNNIFNKHEFHLYGLGSIIEPDVPCRACYKQSFDEQCYANNCMDLITPEAVSDEIAGLLAP